MKTFKIVKSNEPIKTWLIQGCYAGQCKWDFYGKKHKYYYFLDSFGKVHMLTVQRARTWFVKDPIRYTGFNTREEARKVLKRYQMGQNSFWSKMNNWLCTRILGVPLYEL